MVAVGGMAYDDDGIELFRGIRQHSPKRLSSRGESENEIFGERVELHEIIIIRVS